MKMTLIFLLKVIITISVMAAFWVVGNILYATLTDFKPPLEEKLKVENIQKALPQDSVFSFLIWNIGYGGLGKNADFFFDGGKTVITKENEVRNYLKGIKSTLANHSDKDFIMLQEIDVNSNRSWYFDELIQIAKVFPKYSYSYARNYLVDFVPMPLFSLTPMGKVDAGLGTYSKYTTSEATRYQLPGSFPWPKSVYFLDRCILVNRTQLNNGKDLVVINAHNSAYDDTGELKAAEMKFIKEYLLKEYTVGNYVVIGGDWNQSPPNWKADTYKKSGDDYTPANIDANTMPEGWQWAFDASSPTNRNLKSAYNASTTSCAVIDFFLVSPNVMVQKVETHDLQFAYSDHQPVSLKIKLKQ